ncbi:MAG: signal recognition particle-docking protein FtsY [Desulfurococcales archaeon]|nr:signal recognition particle-docking protein FtsY [Desulfurococcales archaeon]
MFGRLKKAIKNGVSKLSENLSSKIAYREIREHDIEELEDDLLFDMVESDVAYETAAEIISSLKKRLTGMKVKRGANISRIIEEAYKEAIREVVSKPESLDLTRIVEENCRNGKLTKIMFLGVNGVGKTTTIAKVAFLLKKKGITPVIAATDTFRAGAQEQLKKHAETLGVPFIGGKYGSDPASVGYDAINYAKARGYCVVLLDTAGRLHVDSDLMEELKKIVRVTKPDYKILVVDALTGNDALEQVKFFDEAVSIDGLILTKMDADVKGGTAVSVISLSGKPVVYIGVGQSYSDLEPFDPEKLVEKMFS